MSNLSSLISTRCPIVNKANWDRLCEEGWRWLANIPLHDHPSAAAMVISAQEDYGVYNVALGDPFNSQRMKPKRDLSGFAAGIYVCDADEQIRLLMITLEIDPREWVVIQG